MRFKIFLITLAVAAGVTAFSLPASANVSTDADESVSVNDSVESYSPLTPSGNLTVIDDVWEQTDEDSIENKQFITVESKNGNIFYIIIDRSGDTENVYFLNAVDEADLTALIEDDDSAAVTAVCTCTAKCELGSVNESCAVCSKNKDDCIATAAAATPAPAENETENTRSSSNPIVILLAFVLLGGGAALYWFKLCNRKPSTKGSTNPEDLYEEDEEDYETEIETETEVETSPDDDTADDGISDSEESEVEDE